MHDLFACVTAQTGLVFYSGQMSNEAATSYSKDDNK
jgi:hypothetical protein